MGNQILLVIVPNQFSKEEIEKFISILASEHKQFKVLLGENINELEEIGHTNEIPEELKHSVIYIGGILNHLGTDAAIVYRYCTDSSFKKALTILMRNTHMFSNPSVVNAFRDMKISKAKLQQLTSVYTDVLNS